MNWLIIHLLFVCLIRICLWCSFFVNCSLLLVNSFNHSGPVEMKDSSTCAKRMTISSVIIWHHFKISRSKLLLCWASLPYHFPFSHLLTVGPESRVTRSQVLYSVFFMKMQKPGNKSLQLVSCCQTYSPAYRIWHSPTWARKDCSPWDSTPPQT